MPKEPPVADDPRFHHEIWSGPTQEYKKQKPSLGYIENYNSNWDYDLAAHDFLMATDQLILVQREQEYIGNWTAPVCYMVRQTLELFLKGLRDGVRDRSNENDAKILFSHNLERIWKESRTWLVDNGYRIIEDARLPDTDRLIANIHAIDPSGDLFRFGTSKYQAFGRSKTYDRVGYIQSDLFREFSNSHGCISHWSAVLMRERIRDEMGWSAADDPYFDADDFPRC